MSPPRLESETFSSVDAAWLHIDTPTNLAIITGVIAFDTVLDFERLKATLENRFLIHKRFRQCVHESSSLLGLPSWETDPDFDIDEHLLHIRLPEAADHNALQQLVSELMSQPLDLSRPLWQFHFVENYLQGSALICRIHHCIADGLALVQILLSIADQEPDAPWPEPPEIDETKPGLIARLLRPAIKVALIAGQTWRTTETLVHEGIDTLIHPLRWLGVAQAATSATMALGKLLFIAPDRKTILRGKCGIAKRAAWTADVNLNEVKAIGRLMGGTVNDILLSAVTGALRRYLEERGEPTIGLNIRAIIPVNLRPADDLGLMGNRFGLVFLSLPIGIRDPLTRLVELRRRMNAIKDTPEAVVAFGILATIGMTPTQIEDIIVAIFGMKGTGVMTNVPGPRQPLYLAGGKITNLMFWVPTPGNLGLGVSMVSYAGQIILGVATDEGLVPDPETILECFRAELGQMSKWGRPSDRPSRPRTPAPAQLRREPLGSRAIDAAPVVGEGNRRCQARTKTGQPCKNCALPGSTTCRIHQGATSNVKFSSPI
jgi:diacylglycerol O-acyltransferase